MVSRREGPSREIKEMSESIRQSSSICIDHDETYGLICAQCFDDSNRHVEVAGCCADCEDLLCKECIGHHRRIRALKTHTIVEFTCAQCLDENTTVTAAGFCNDCYDYLCTKCIVQHRTIRALKKHTVLVGENMPVLPVNKILPIATPKDEIKMKDAGAATGIDSGISSISLGSDSLGSSNKDNSNSARRIDTCMSSMSLGSDSMGSDNKENSNSVTGTVDISLKSDSLGNDNKESSNSMAGIDTDMSSISLGSDSLRNDNKENSNSVTGIDTDMSSISLGSDSLGSDNKDDSNLVTRIDTGMPSILFGSDSLGSYSRSLLQHSEKKESFEAKSPTDTVICWIRSSVVLPTGEVVVSDSHNKNLKMFDQHLRECSKLSPGSYPRDMCISNANSKEIYVTLPELESIYCVGVEDGLKMRNTMIVDGECYGVTCWKSGIAITAWYVNKHRWELQLLDYDGNLIKRILQDTTKRLEFHWPEYLTSIMNGKQIIISDSNASRVTNLDADSGRVMFVYKDESLEWPVSMASDSQDNIYVVGNWSQNVHMISAMGEKLAVILSQQDGLHYPTGISYNSGNDTLTLQPSKARSEMVSFKAYD